MGPLKSPSVRGRGLKQPQPAGRGDAPPSPSVRGRGLKPAVHVLGRASLQSPSVRGRGLKHGAGYLSQADRRVALRAGAWIETPAPPPPPTSATGRPPCGGVD